MGLPAANLPIPGSNRPGAPGSRTATVSSSGVVGRPTAVISGSTPAPQLTPLPSVVAPPVAGAALDAALDAVMNSDATNTPAAPFSTTVSSLVSQAVGSAVDEKMAAISARGPEYAAIAKLSRAIIEAIIREHLEKQGRN